MIAKLVIGLLPLLAGGGMPPRDEAWVESEVNRLQPTADERRIDRIGWAADLRTALRLAKEHHRPLFVFTMDGRFSIGRC
jgi:hypothetical protein